MSKKRIVASLFLPLLLASFLQSQSLAELSKKEKERRAANKGKTTTVTSADIAKVKKRPAVETTEAQAAVEEEAQAGEAQVQQEGAPPAAAQQAAEAAAQAEKPAEEAPQPDPVALSAQENQRKLNELATISEQKNEMVDLLTLKLNSLYQEFHGLDNVKSRELVQVQISETYDKLLKAEAEAVKAKKDLEDFMARTKKATAQKIWIK
jgi:hypothetical protein